MPNSSGFHSATLYRRKNPEIFSVAKQKISFLIATMSLIAFVMGNMVGQHGWYAFFRTVLGKEDDAAVAFVGTVPPIQQIPLYSEWAKYGGNKREHTFAQVPKNVLRDLPQYDQSALTNGTADPLALQAYSTLWAGGYNSPYGSHAGVDIDAVSGTPIYSIANGIVDKVSMGTVGFGHYVMIRHPNVPDGNGGTRTLYSTYAHMDDISVMEGQLVHKGQFIGTVGNTGLVFGATGYHLYFQVNTSDAPYNPYWPFTSGEIADKGISFVQAVNSTTYRDRVTTYTLNPMQFVQDYAQYTSTTIARTNSSLQSVVAQSVTSSLSSLERLRLSVSERRSLRIAERTHTAAPVVVAAASAPSFSAPVIVPDPVVVPQSDPVVDVVKTVSLSGQNYEVVTGSNTDVDHLEFSHSGVAQKTWQKVRITALDSHGDIVRTPSFSGRLYIMPTFGDAIVRPTELSPLDFDNGIATINVLSRGSKSLILSTRGAFNTSSLPLVPVR